MTDDREGGPTGDEPEEPPVEQVVDELPDDLDPSKVQVPYTFPNNSRRRVPAALYLVMAAATFAAAAVAADGSPRVNRGLLVAAGLLVAFAIYGFIAGRTLRVDETEALGAANRVVGFPVGHASAQMAWRGLDSRPVWRLLVYSAENPPARRAMVVVDGSTGEVVEWFAEDNPEDWSSLGQAG